MAMLLCGPMERLELSRRRTPAILRGPCSDVPGQSFVPTGVEVLRSRWMDAFTSEMRTTPMVSRAAPRGGAHCQGGASADRL
jgi:hypothetical protein